MPVSNPPVQQLLARAADLQRTGRWTEAIPLYEQALRNNKPNVEVLVALATCEVTVERLDSARQHLKAAAKLAPNDARIRYVTAYSWKRQGCFDEAIAEIDEAIRRAPANAAYVAGKAEILHMAGRSEEALNVISTVLRHAPSVPLVASVFAVIALRVKRERQAIPLMEQVLARRDLQPAARIKFTFDLANLYNAVGEYAQAFTLYQRGNKLKGERWDAAKHTHLIDSIIREWSEATVRPLPRSPIDGSKYIFIIGMPRSGTSLVEQIVSMAEGVHAAGERNDLLRIGASVQGSIPMGIPMVWNTEKLRAADAVQRYTETYINALGESAGPSAARITDKMPVNFLLLGLVHILLPGAKVIHCRRNPMDTCLSCYFQLFGGSLGFAYDLSHCGRFYVDYERMMAHWPQVIDTPILDVQYEHLVTNQEPETRRIFEFLGLPFTEAALSFHTSNRPTLTASGHQVREPIHPRSVERWKHYEAFLDPLKTALGPYAK